MFRVAIVGLVLMLPLIGFSGDSTWASSTPEQESANLRDRVDQLERRLQELERRLAEPLTITPAPLRPQVPPGPSSVPDGWQPFHFNGMVYYLIPADQARALIQPPAMENPNP